MRDDGVGELDEFSFRPLVDGSWRNLARAPDLFLRMARKIEVQQKSSKSSRAHGFGQRGLTGGYEGNCSGWHDGFDYESLGKAVPPAAYECGEIRSLRTGIMSPSSSVRHRLCTSLTQFNFFILVDLLLYRNAMK